MPKKLHNVRLDLPPWIPTLYILMAIVLVPWTIGLSFLLPAKHLVSHWDVAWVGFDGMMLLAVILTAIGVIRRRWWASLTSMAVFTILVVDGWFDVLTSRPGRQTFVALVLALAVEVPIALTSLWLSTRIARELLRIND